MKRLLSYVLCVSLLVPLVQSFSVLSLTASAQDAVTTKADIKAGIQRLKIKTNGAALVDTSPATGAARFVRMSSGTQASFSGGIAGSLADKSAAFFQNYGSAFGVTNPAAELQRADQKADNIGGQHLDYNQVYKGVPVFGGVLMTHFNGTGELYSVNGNFIPDINLNHVPTRQADEAAAAAVRHVAASLSDDESGAKSVTPLAALGKTLYVFRTNLARGIPGENHLVWEVEVRGSSVREFVYVDAHTLKVVDQITGIHDAMNRRAYDGQGNTNETPPNYPNNPYWVEGQLFPTASTEANNMITSSKEVYDFYKNAFGRDSFDNTGATMDAIFNRGNACPNASWNGTFISFCPGYTTDDVTAHEWSHAYTQYTHNLVYQWQPGALNEAYSDIFGETIDILNNRDTIGNSTTDPLRTLGNCSTSTTSTRRQMVINSPANLAGFSAGTPNAATFGPALTTTGVTGNVVLVVDNNSGGGTDANDGCGAITNAAALAGKIALVNRSATCTQPVRVKNAQNAGAIAVLIANNAATGLGTMTGTDATITIPSLAITQIDGNQLKNNIASTPNVTLRLVAKDASTRWLMGEDVTPGGALRDMSNPNCYANPARVNDTAHYTCSTADGGGVHTNSGVPNHAYALIVDGGTYNGQTITGLGMTKAAHIYFRAESVYQHATTDFADHAVALEQAALDLKNASTNLNKLTDGTPSGEIITAADLDQVHKAVLATELNAVPTFCNFQPLLAQSPPADTCGAGTVQSVIFSEDFEGSTSGWTISHTSVGAGYNMPDWVVSSTLPDGRAGKGFFAEDSNIGGCNASDDESGVQSLTSPTINIPSGVASPVLRFAHWVSTESTYDGGQLWVSLDGGAFTLVPQAAFTYNAHTGTFTSSAGGNTNPRASQRAWTGTDGGRVGGTWGTTVVNLSALGATGGHNIKLRYDMSQDGCGGTTFGWYIDDVKVSSCEVALPTYHAAFDFDGDNKADFATFRGEDGYWNALSSSGGSPRTLFWGGESLGDEIVPGDYDGDGKTDFTVYRTSTGQWFISKNSGGDIVVTWGSPSTQDKPVPADYDGDGKTDIAVFRPLEGSVQGVWYILKSTDNFNQATHIRKVWGASTDVPVPADFNKDGKADFAVVRSNDPGAGQLTWYIGYNGLSTYAATQWGATTDKLVVGDYDGDRQADVAVFRPSDGNWYVLKSSGGWIGSQWGQSADIPVQADFDGDGKTDLAVYRPSDNTWYVQGSTSGFSQQLFGSANEAPVQAYNQ
ncbi:MAG TPA: M4 family metallopeptidase [Pyrinomonadaceae bacterium]